MIDLRSDTLTLPDAAMREAMAAAELGDDVYGEDPTVARLQTRAAELLGKEAALFVPSGTMANQIALLCHCRPGDHVLVGELAHCMLYESGGAAALAGAQLEVVGQGGLFTAEQVRAAIHPGDHHYAPTRLVALENTHNRAGGRVFPSADVEAIAQLCRQRGLSTHMDGARIWNASVASGLSPAALSAPLDSVSACFSKGLGAPVGSVIAGTAALVERAHRYRKMLGGGMRQAGVLAAAALHALEHNLPRLGEDHDKARRFARGVASIAGLGCEPDAVETNIVNIDVLKGTAADLQLAVAAAGLRVGAVGPQRLRAVMHLDVDSTQVDRAVQVLAEVSR